MSRHPDAKPSAFPAIAVDYLTALRSPGRDWMYAYHEEGGATVWRRIRLLPSIAERLAAKRAAKQQEARR